MKNKQIKGIIQKTTYHKKYDSDGNAYKDYSFVLHQTKYNSQIYETFYLSDGMEVILALKQNSDTIVIAGYCLKEDYVWGELGRELKKLASVTDKYDFREGIVTEKRKCTSGSIDLNNIDNSSRISYTIIIDKMYDFHASEDEGIYLQLGMNIAVVLEKNSSVLILNKETGEILGDAKPYYVLIAFILFVFNVFMFYIHFIKQSHLFNFTTTLIVFDLFLISAFVLSFFTYRVTSVAKKFLFSKLKIN